MIRIKITAKAKKELKLLSQRHKEAIGLAIEELKESPTVGKLLTRELTGKLSYRVGIYRIIYKINSQDKTILILTAGHRSVVYN